MAQEIRYAVDIIVGVLYFSQWMWYLSEKDYWFMDLIKMEQNAIDAGENIRIADYSDRFNIAVLNEKTAEQFFAAMKHYRVDKATLSKLFLHRDPITSWDEIIDLCPSLLINFDRKQLTSLFPEPVFLENYVPDDWSGEYENFLDQVPVEERYWVIDGHDYFQQFIKPIQ